MLPNQFVIALQFSRMRKIYTICYTFDTELQLCIREVSKPYNSNPYNLVYSIGYKLSMDPTVDGGDLLASIVTKCTGNLYYEWQYQRGEYDTVPSITDGKIKEERNIEGIHIKKNTAIRFTPHYINFFDGSLPWDLPSFSEDNELNFGSVIMYELDSILNFERIASKQAGAPAWRDGPYLQSCSLPLDKLVEIEKIWKQLSLSQCKKVLWHDTHATVHEIKKAVIKKMRASLVDLLCSRKSDIRKLKNSRAPNKDCRKRLKKGCEI